MPDPKTPGEISIQNGISISHVSRALAQLRLKKLVYCATPKLVKGRVYKLTNKGIEIANKVSTL